MFHHYPYVAATVYLVAELAPSFCDRRRWRKRPR